MIDKLSSLKQRDLHEILQNKLEKKLEGFIAGTLNDKRLVEHFYCINDNIGVEEKQFKIKLCLWKSEA